MSGPTNHHYLHYHHHIVLVSVGQQGVLKIFPPHEKSLVIMVGVGDVTTNYQILPPSINPPNSRVFHFITSKSQRLACQTSLFEFRPPRCRWKYLPPQWRVSKWIVCCWSPRSTRRHSASPKKRWSPGLDPHQLEPPEFGSKHNQVRFGSSLLRTQVQ